MTRQGSTVDPEVRHRRLLDLEPPLLPLEDGSLFDRIGGQATVDRLVDSLYDRFEADAVIRAIFGRDLVSGRNRQKRFFSEWLGGPPRYSESAWGALYQHHEDLPITQAVAERWLDHLRGALSDAVPAETDAASILRRARPSLSYPAEVATSFAFSAPTGTPPASRSRTAQALPRPRSDRPCRPC